MKLFTLDKNGKFVQFKEEDFKTKNKEIDLEDILENNPEYFFENSKILIIGRQVTTNLNTFVDLLGIDESGNTVVIELKRDKTPRETLAQLIEYASFVDNLDYEQLNEIYSEYSGEEIGLEEYHHEYFETTSEQNISWNKLSKLVIVAQDITSEIKQASLYLRRKGIDVYCIEFKYFMNNEGTKMISSDFVVGDEEYLRQKYSSTTQQPKTDKNKFINSLNSHGKPVFEKIFSFADNENLFIKWGTKGFSMNLSFDGELVAICFGYPPTSVFKQSIYVGFEVILKKINNADSVKAKCKKLLDSFNRIEPAKSEHKWVIDKKYSEKDIETFISILRGMVKLIRAEGLRN